MRAALVALVGLVGACAAAQPARDEARANAFACPSAGENSEDCPYAAVARAMRAEEEPARGAKERIKSVLRARLPRVYADIVASRSLGGTDLTYFDLWGRSSNYDASQLDRPAPAPTVDEPVLDAINDLAGIPNARHGNFGNVPNAITSAGIEHTYGYLFSLLPTPFGFKRARWVQGDLEAGFGLVRGTLGPAPTGGSLFANVTYFCGRIAFRNASEQRERLALDAGAPTVAPELVGFDYAALAPVRLQEWLSLPGPSERARTVVLRTDFVAYVARKVSPGGTTHLLVYSIYDSHDGRSRLITVFPVDDGARAQALDSARLGQGQRITTQYNAFVEGVTAAATPLTGTRRVLAAGE